MINTGMVYKRIDGEKRLVHIKSGYCVETRGNIASDIDRLRTNVRDYRMARRYLIEQFKRDAQGNRLYSLIGGVHTSPDQVRSVWFNRKLSVLNSEKLPRSKGNHTGIELELRSSLERRPLQELILAAGLEKHVNVASDGSIRVDGSNNCDSCNGDCDCQSVDEAGDTEHGCECTCADTSGPYIYGHELRVIVVNSKLEDVVTRLCNVLNTKGDVDINDSCGMHVHLDMRNRDPERVFNNLQRFQKLLYAMCPIRRYQNDYCKPFRTLASWDARTDRYMGINKQSFEKHKTIEVRIHSGTTNRDKILYWTKLLNAIADMDYPLSIMVASVDHARVLLGLDAETMRYIESRVRKFDSDHKSGLLVEPMIIPTAVNSSAAMHYATGLPELGLGTVTIADAFPVMPTLDSFRSAMEQCIRYSESQPSWVETSQQLPDESESA